MERDEGIYIQRRRRKDLLEGSEDEEDKKCLKKKVNRNDKGTGLLCRKNLFKTLGGRRT